MTATQTIAGAASWRLAARGVEAFVTRTGGHLAPVTFDLAGRFARPFQVAPWAEEANPRDLPNILRVLRGDFFCLPFGDPMPHGETANADWSLNDLDDGGRTLQASMDLPGGGRVEKTIRLADGESVVYQRHVVTGLDGPQCFGHHATLKFPDEPGCARVSTSRFVRGQAFIDPTERPEVGGYSCLQPAATFDDLARVPKADGGTADLTRYPARRGFEDIVQLFADPSLDLAWSAASVASAGYVWFSLRDPKILTGTLLWHSNGGRHYAPWNGRHVNVLGVEDVTAFFHLGRDASVSANAATDAGLTTALSGDLDVRYVFGVAAVDPDFGLVVDIRPEGDGVTLTDDAGRAARAAVDLSFLRA